VRRTFVTHCVRKMIATAGDSSARGSCSAASTGRSRSTITSTSSPGPLSTGRGHDGRSSSVRTDDGVELKLHALRTVPFNEIGKWQPIAGERNGVTYRGAGQAMAGMNAPHLYRVRVEGRSGTGARAIFRRLQGPATPPPAQPDHPADMPEDDRPPL